MAQHEHAFRSHEDTPWDPAPGYESGGAEEKTLFRQEGGAHARLVRWPAGFVTGTRPLVHPDVDEFAWVVSGTSRSLASGVEAGPGWFCAIPAGIEHGPFATDEGVVLFELRVPTDASTGGVDT